MAMLCRCTLLMVVVLVGAASRAAAADYGIRYTGQVTPTPRQVLSEWHTLSLRGKAVRLDVAPEVGGATRLGAQLLRERLLAAGASLAEEEASDVRIVVGCLSDQHVRQAADEAGLSLENLVLPTQGYIVRIVRNAESPMILAAGVGDRGTFYALATLYQLTGDSAENPVLRVADIDDWPTWRTRFASDYTPADRDGLIRLALYKINGFAFQHRYNWREFDVDAPKYASRLDAMKQFNVETGLFDFMLLLNLYAERPRREPIFDVTNEEHLTQLLERLEGAIDHGISNVMICLDDWTPMEAGVYVAPNPSERQRFGDNAGATHGYLMERLSTSLDEDHPAVELMVCPAPYSLHHVQDFDTPGGQQYLRDLAAALPPDLTVVWTGPVVSSPRIKREDFLQYAELVMNEQPLMLWDNTNAVASNSRDIPTMLTRFYEGFEADSAGRVFLNGFILSRPWIALCGISSNDYLWNPEGFDEFRSHQNVTQQRYGRDSYALVEAFRQGQRQFIAAGDDAAALRAAYQKTAAAMEAMEAAGLPTRRIRKSVARYKAQAMDRPPSVQVARTPTAPTIDGRIDEAMWDAAGRITAFEPMNEGESVAHTIGRIAYDDSALYLAFEASHDQPLSKPVGADHRDAPIYALADNLQVFLRAPGGSGSIIQLIFDHEMNKFDMATESGKSWDGDWQVVVQKQPGVWTAEVRIPFETMMPPFESAARSGSTWTGNFCRSRPEASEHASWSSTHGNKYVDSTFFGTLVFE